MLRLLPLKLLSSILLMLIIMFAITGAHASTHTTVHHATEVTTLSTADMSFSHACPGSPLDQHQESDGCDDCDSCACHAPLIVLPYRVAYHPLMLHLDTPDPFTYLPEIYPSRFVPPQEQA